MITPGEKYHLSNKFEKEELYKVILTMICICIPVGWLFHTMISSLYGYQHWTNLLFKGGLSLICLLLSSLFCNWVNSRNLLFDFLIVLFTSILSWYGMWSSMYAHFSEGNFFISLVHPHQVIMFYADYVSYTDSLTTDQIAFFISIYIMSFNNEDNTQRYCEDCKTNYQEYIFYINDGKAFEKVFVDNKDGNFSFISTFDFVYSEEELMVDGLKNSDLEGKESTENAEYQTEDKTAYMFRYFRCPKCINNILSIYIIDKYRRIDEDKKMENKYTQSENDLGVTNIYIDQITRMLLDEKLKDKFSLTRTQEKWVTKNGIVYH